jgi:hypothetical protein
MNVKVIVPHILHGANSIVARSEPLAKPDALESAGRGPKIVHARSTWGLRHLEAVAAIAHSAGFLVRVITEMPANNLSVVFRRMCIMSLRGRPPATETGILAPIPLRDGVPETNAAGSRVGSCTQPTSLRSHLGKLVAHVGK